MWKSRSRWVGCCVGRLGAAVLALVLACDDGSLQRVRSAGVLRAGYAVEAPYAMVLPGGEVTGESPETARLLARRLGIERVEWVQAAFASLIPDLLDHRFDVIAAGMFVTKERATRVRFSQPTLRVGSGLLVPKGNPQGLMGFAELRPDPRRRIAVLSGSVEQARLQARGFSGQALLLVPDAQAGKAAVAQGAAHALALSSPAVRWMARNSPERYEALLDGAPRSEAGDDVAFAFRREDESLARAWNVAEQAFIGSREHLSAIAAYAFEAADVVPLESSQEAAP